MQSLDRAGIKYSSKAGEIAEFEINGLKIGLVAFSFGSSPRSVVHPESALREIGSLSPHYDILLVSVHGGSEGMPALHVRNESEFFVGEPPGNLIEFAHEARKLSEEDFPETSPLFRMSEIVPR